MNISTISYWFYEAFESMKKNMKNVLISVSTMIATMIIVAVGYLLVVNASYIIEQKQEASSKVAAYFYYDIEENKIDTVKNALVDKGLDDIVYYASDDAIEFANSIKDGLLDGFDEEALLEICQPFFEIRFDSVEEEDLIREVLNQYKSKDGGIEDIRIPNSAVDAIKTAKSIRIIAFTCMILIIELSVFLMMNSTKLMLYARRKEISIMKYVGAKDTFVKAPFAIEGIIMALVAAIIVILVISISYEPIVEFLETSTINYKCLPFSEVMPNLRLILLAIGVGIGAFGSTISMNKYLDV